MQPALPARDAGSERGFGMVEVIVSMFLLAIMAMAILPIMISSLKLASKNVSLTTATQLLDEQMDTARGLAPTCAALQAFSHETVGLLVTDPRGTILEVHRDTPATCPVAYPTAFTFVSWVTVQGDTVRLAQSETRVHLERAS